MAEPSVVSALSVLLVIENSAKVSSDWTNLRDRYIRTTIDSLKASNAALPMNIMVLPSLPARKEEFMWTLPQRYGDLQDFEFNVHPDNKLSAGHIHSGIEFLSSYHAGASSSVERHIFIVAATTPSENISGVDCAGRSVWLFLAQQLADANIFCHLIVSSNNDVGPLSILYEETLRLQGHQRHSFNVMPWFASNSQAYSLRLATRPTQPSSPLGSVPLEPRASTLKHDPSTSSTVDILPNASVEASSTPAGDKRALGAYPHQSHSISRLRSGHARRSQLKEDQTSSSTEATPRGRTAPSYKVERSSRAAGITRSTSDSSSPSSVRGCHISSFTPGVTTLLPIPPAPTVASLSKPQMSVQTLLPIPPAPSSKPRSLIALPVPPAPLHTSNKANTHQLSKQNLHMKEPAPNSVVEMSTSSTPSNSSQRAMSPNPQRDDLKKSAFVEDEELMLDALLDPNHHFTLDFFQTNLLPMFDANEAKMLLTNQDKKPITRLDNTPRLESNIGSSFGTPLPEHLALANNDLYPFAEFDASATDFSLGSPITPYAFSGGTMLADYNKEREMRSARLLPTPLLSGNDLVSSNRFSMPSSPSSTAMRNPEQEKARREALSAETASSLQGWAG